MLGDLGKLIVAKGFKKLPKVQKIARSGHTGRKAPWSTSGNSNLVFVTQVRFTVTMGWLSCQGSNR